VSPEDKFWAIRCKVCSKLHRATPTIPPGVYQPPIPAQGVVECPENPGKTAEYFGSEWLMVPTGELPDSTSRDS